MTDAFESRFFTTHDGLRLHLRDYAGGPRTPVVCLPGLARTAADFDALALRLRGEGHRVVAIDYRGRGLSEWDRKAENYDIRVENADILSMLAGAGVGRAHVVGTSRGGIHAMVTGVTRPTLLRSVVLNDIGAVIEGRGLARIKGYVGKLPQPKSWADAVDLFQRMAGAHFTALSEEDWQEWARLTLEEKDGRLVPRYDPRLSETLKDFDIEKGVPALWPQFEALRHVPVLVVRGENSDLLSAETVAEMQRRHPDCEAHVVPGQGHAPLLADTASLDRIAAFIARVEASPALPHEPIRKAS